MTMRLDGKTILITGAASGIGQASALKALGEGARVIGIDLSGDGMPDGVEPILGDVAHDETIARALAAGGRIDGLATIAGISESGVAIDAIEPDSWDRVFAINVKATWRWLIAVLPAMREQGGGSVVAIASQQIAPDQRRHRRAKPVHHV
jgi:NAD(P)-dependent dehydrogenase (short-subunit alcohol dehydrogenase family)